MENLKKYLLVIIKVNTLSWSSTHLILLTSAQLNSYLSAKILRNSKILALKYSVCQLILISLISLGQKLQETKEVLVKLTILFLQILAKECPKIMEFLSKRKQMLCTVLHLEDYSFLMEITKLDQFKLMMMQLEDQLTRPLDSFKVSNSQINTEKYAQLTGNQVMLLSNQIKIRKRNSFQKLTKPTARLATYEELKNH